MQQETTGFIPRPKRRIRSLDGLRAFAILGVLLYHLRMPWLPSGHLGVVVFLVLSGYLVTNSFVLAYDKNASMRPQDLVRAWWRRVRRLWPSVATLVAITVALCASLSPVLLTKMRPDVLPALGFFENWSYIVRGSSYFDQIGGPSPLQHLWYLGVDLQFFLVWTILLTLLLRAGKVAARRVALLLAIASAALMAWLYVPGADPSRVYYGTDTRAFSLLLGAWLALVFPLGKAPVLFGRLLVREASDRGTHAVGIPYRATILSHLLGIASVAGIVALMVLLPQDSPVFFLGGLAGVSALVVVLMATMLAPGSVADRLFSLPPLAALGRRAFALYLWHFPIFQLMGADKTTTVWYLRLAAVGIALVAAELSLRLIERPFSPQPKPTGNVRPEDQRRHVSKRLVVTSLVVVAIGCYAAYAYQHVADQTLVPEEALVSTGAAADQAMQLDRPQQAKDDQEPANGDSGDGESSQSEQVDAPAQEAAPTVSVDDSTIVLAPAAETNSGVYDPVLIGDSVPGDADWSVRLPNALVDTYIGRRPDQALEVIRGYVDQGVVGKVVVYACFSNTTPYPDTLQSMIEVLGSDRQVFLVGTVNPDGFQDEANANLQDAASQYENVHYVDWPSVLDGHMSEYLWADDTHLRPEGAVVYVDMVVRAVAQAMVDAGGTTTTA